MRPRPRPTSSVKPERQTATATPRHHHHPQRRPLLSTVALTAAVAAAVHLRAVRPTDAFAQWTRCTTDLDEGEIIMNHPIRDQSSTVASERALLGYGGGATRSASGSGSSAEMMGGGMVPRDVDGRAITTLPRLVPLNGDTGDPLPPHDSGPNVPPSQVSYLYEPGDVVSVRLYPTTLADAAEEASRYANSSEMQEMVSGSQQRQQRHLAADEVALLSDNMQWVAQSTAGGAFSGKNSMCRGRRAVGQTSTAVARLELSGEREFVTVWAGYADERAQVVLTGRIVFRRVKGGLPGECLERRRREEEEALARVEAAKDKGEEDNGEETREKENNEPTPAKDREPAGYQGHQAPAPTPVQDIQPPDL